MAEFDDYSLVAAQLHTGRTHQIRVHFQHLGHPLVGDDLYDEASSFIDRQALHCQKLSFIDPWTAEPFVQEAPLPKDIQQFIRQVGGINWLEKED